MIGTYNYGDTIKTVFSNEKLMVTCGHDCHGKALTSFVNGVELPYLWAVKINEPNSVDFKIFLDEVSHD